MNEMLAELQQLQGQVKALEETAIAHEQSARKARADRDQCKLRISEIHRAINDSAMVVAAQGAVAAARQAQAAAESHANELAAALKRLQEKEALLDARLAQTPAA